MVTYCATKLTVTCSPMIGQFLDTMSGYRMVVSSGYECYRAAIMIYHTLSLGKYWKLFQATLKGFILTKFAYNSRSGNSSDISQSQSQDC